MVLAALILASACTVVQYAPLATTPREAVEAARVILRKDATAFTALLGSGRVTLLGDAVDARVTEIDTTLDAVRVRLVDVRLPAKVRGTEVWVANPLCQEKRDSAPSSR